MAAIQGARERARVELTREIKEEARRQLADQGAQQLSLRAVARALGMASSAVYRYFPSRDDLLTALIMDAYLELGEHAEHAVAAAGPAPRARWRAGCGAVRDWARSKPHEYALLYGTPVPGYHAPPETIAAAARVPLALLGVVRDAAGRLAPAAAAATPPGPLSSQLSQIAQEFAPGLPITVVARTVMAWTQLFGMVGFELFGHLNGTIEPADHFFGYAVEEWADTLGLPGN
ncbi:TetR/AcrR family transcriptional regulator [Kitasatospora viridis]|uniref:TetR family transcriptional regulator n=1 Tax=Kitasatospora viridis TaxID=281105 RepID=A0A561UF54_9ACTN|nr:TetR/AcrR family transcriptional regulator [Kitasatospora viridis]TWF97993.1 TetR family transcriptional regulator [Kitasatospora viridis]